MNLRALPPWVAPLVTILELAALLFLEQRQPLRPPSEDKLVRDIRNLVIAATAAIPVALIETPIAQRLAALVERKRWGLLRRLRLPHALETLFAIALLDYTMYAWHALMHRVPLLWRFHLVHHIDRDEDATTALRFHVGEVALSLPFRALQVVAIGVSARAFSVWQVLFAMSILFHHSNLRLPERLERRLEQWIMTPRIHGIHHAAIQQLENANFSSGLMLWDHLHGTVRADVLQETMTIGLPAYRSDEDVALETLLYFHFDAKRTPGPMIPLIDRKSAPLLARPYLEGDEPSTLAAVMAHVPELLEAAMPFIAAIYGPTALSERLKEIVILRTSALNHCRFCTRSHAELAAQAGLSAEQIAFLRGERAMPGTFDARECAALAFAQAFCERPAESVSTLRPLFRDDEIVELALLAGATVFLNRFCTAMGLA